MGKMGLVRIATMALVTAQGALALAVADGEFMAEVSARNPEIPPHALKIAYQYFKKNENTFTNKDYITVVDFNRPSNVKRMYVIDMRTGNVDRFHVAHGQGSGGKIATTFSNENDSHMSSLGLYRTFRQNEKAFSGENGLYTGKHGLSLRVKGLQASNSLAERRLVVIHGAEYVAASYIRKQGYAGRSWGCFAVDPDEKERFMNKVEGGSLLLAFHNSMLR